MAISTKTPIDYAALEAETPVQPVAPKGNDGTKVAKADKLKVIHVQRYISTGAAGAGGSYPVEAVNKTLSDYVDQGYKLFSAHYIGTAPEGIGMLYVLVLG